MSKEGEPEVVIGLESDGGLSLWPEPERPQVLSCFVFHF